MNRTFSFALCDDDRGFLEDLNQHLNKYATETGFIFETHLFSTGEDLRVFVQSHEGRIHAFFLDVELPDIDGISLAQTIRSSYQEEFMVIHMSYLNDYAPSVFQVNSKGFLTKPLKGQELYALLGRVLPELEGMLSFYDIIIDGLPKSLALSKVLYFEVIGKHIYAVTQEETYVFKGKFSDLCQDLKNRGFFQTHRSYLVNSRQILKRTPQKLILTNGSEVPISRGRRGDLENQLMQSLRELKRYQDG